MVCGSPGSWFASVGSHGLWFARGSVRGRFGSQTVQVSLSLYLLLVLTVRFHSDRLRSIPVPFASLMRNEVLRSLGWLPLATLYLENNMCLLVLCLLRWLPLAVSCLLNDIMFVSRARLVRCYFSRNKILFESCAHLVGCLRLPLF